MLYSHIDYRHTDIITTTRTTKTTLKGDSLSPDKEEKLSKLSKLSSNEKSELYSRILLVYVTPSGKGLKVVFKADVKKGNLIDNQHAMAQVLGVEVDESCKDASRMSFICKESDILYIDKELFTYENKEFSERFTALYRDGHSQATKLPSSWETVRPEGALATEGTQDRPGVEEINSFTYHQSSSLM